MQEPDMEREGADRVQLEPGPRLEVLGAEEGELGGWVDPQVPGAEEPPGLEPDGWDMIDGVSAWETFLCPFRQMEFVPLQHKEVWGWAWGEVLRRIKGAEGKTLERGLKWLTMLPQLLLRAPRRGGQPGRGDIARRFSCLSVRQDFGALLALWRKDSMKLREEQSRVRRG